MFYYTSQRDKDAMQYVNIYLLSGPTFYQMFYYSYHSDMDTPQYVHIDVSSDYLFYWTF
jgi:spore coat polysaccharide biosynthesis protein SpsF (cytidylyltransferase family)